MPMNFLGLGFLFGARDKGLAPTLDKVQTQLTAVNGVFEDLQNTAKTGLTTEGLVEATSAFEGLKAAAAESVQGGTVVEALNEQIDELREKTKGGGIADALDVGESLRGNVFDEFTKGVSAAGDATRETAKSTKGGSTAFGQLANMVLAGSGKISAGLGWIGLVIGPVISGFGSIAEAADSMLERVTGIPARMGENLNRITDNAVNLTNSLEGEATALNQTARQIGTNLGYTGANFTRFTRQATGMAMGLNIGAEEAGAALYGWDQAAEVLRETGLRSARDLARFSAGLGVNAQELTNAQVAMTRLGMSSEQVGQLTRVFATAGQTINDVAGTMGEMPGLMDVLTRRQAAFGESGAQLQEFATQTLAASGALYQVTNNSEQARSMAQELAEQLTESRDRFQGLFAGVGDELPEFITQMSSVSGDVDEAFRMMGEGPAGLIEGLQQLYESARESGADVGQVTNFMRQRLEGQLGSAQNAVFALFHGMETGSITGVGEMVARIREGNTTLGELADQSFTTGRTMQENYERMIEMFQTSFRRLGRGAAQRFMTETRERLHDLQGAMTHAAEGAGPLAAVMRSMATADILGPLSLLPADMQGTAVAADQLRDRMMPLIGAFTSWGGLLDTVGNFIALFATDVMLAQEETDNWGLAIDQVATRYGNMFVNWIKEAEGFLVRFADGFANFNWDNLFGREGSQSGVMGAFRRVFERIGNMDWSRIWGGIRQGLSNLFERLTPWFEEKWEQLKDVVQASVVRWWSDIDWAQLWLDVQTLAGALWDAIRPALVQLGSDLFEWLGANWTDLFVDAVQVLLWVILGLLAVAAVVIVAALVAPFAIAAAAMYAWVVEGYEYFAGLGDELAEIGQWIATVLGDYFRGLGRDIGEIWQFVSSEFRDAWEAISDWFRRTWDRVSRWFGRLWDGVTRNIQQAGQDWASIFSTVVTSIQTFFSGMWTGIQNAAGTVISWIVTRWESFTSSLSGIWTTVSEGWTTFISGAETALTNLTTIPDRLRTAWSGIVAFFRGIFEGVRTAIGDDLGAAGALFDRMSGVATRALQLITGTADEEFGHSIHTVVGEDMAQTEAIMTETALRVSDVMQRVLYEATVTSIVEGFSDGFARVSENMEEFSVDLTRQFEDLADNISDIMTDLFVVTVQQAEASMLAVETSVEGIVANLRSVTAAQEQLARTQETRLSTPADEAAYQARLAALENNAVLLAVNNPLWWSANGVGYRDLFDSRMRELIDAVRASARAGGAGGGGGGDQAETVRLLREAVEAIRRGQRTAPTGRGGAGQPRVRRP